MADFDPRQLDQLEDALEQLEHVDELDELGLDPELRERLAEYQDVLALCREAFPVEDPADSVLADVIAEAHEVSRRPRLRDAIEGEGSHWRRVWERWRGTLVPSLALAGTAAVVLLLLDPTKQADDPNMLSSKTDDIEQVDRAELDKDAAELDSDAAELERSQPASERELDEPAAIEQPQPKPVVDPAPSGGSSSYGSESKAKAAKKSASPPAPSPSPALEPLSKDEAWTTLDRGDADRRRGDCDRARAYYEQVIDASPDTLAKARAKAGIGLCLERDRRDSEANEWFAKARATNPGVGTWINQERDQTVPKKKSQARQAEAMEADAL